MGHTTPRSRPEAPIAARMSHVELIVLVAALLSIVLALFE